MAGVYLLTGLLFVCGLLMLTGSIVSIWNTKKGSIPVLVSALFFIAAQFLGILTGTRCTSLNLPTAEKHHLLIIGPGVLLLGVLALLLLSLLTYQRGRKRNYLGMAAATLFSLCLTAALGIVMYVSWLQRVYQLILSPTQQMIGWTAFITALASAVCYKYAKRRESKQA